MGGAFELAASSIEPAVLEADDYRHYVDYFNSMEDENIVQAIPNAESWDWMRANIPLFEAPQQNFEESYYYRWWTLRKHIRETPVGHAFTEFLVDRPYADEYNLISCALGHHIMESRWLHDSTYTNEGVHVWFRGNDGGPMEKLHRFSSWTAFALLEKYKLDGDKEYLLDMLPDLVAEFETWEEMRGLPNGMFWQYDVQDGMEEQISGGRHVKNTRPTINSYMFGNAIAIAEIAKLAGKTELAERFAERADELKKLTQETLWNDDRSFFETVLETTGTHAEVREAIGFIPWYFNLPEAGHEAAWGQLTDKEGFWAPFGLTTAERRHPAFRTHGCCNCEWDGAVWPFATSQTLTAMANLLNHYDQDHVDREDYFRAMERYVQSQYYRGLPYIGEYLDEVTGYWLKGDQERSRYYNHSTFNDLIITGLVGLRPRMDDTVEVSPLLPEGIWDWFCLDAVEYHGRSLTIIWDKDGSKYNRGAGLTVLVDGEEIAHSAELERVTGKLP
jgi:hypothetical protein